MSALHLYEDPGVSLAPLDTLRFQGDLLVGAWTLAERIERLVGRPAVRLPRPRAGGLPLPLGPASATPAAPSPGLYLPANLLLQAPLPVEGPPEVGMLGQRVAWLRLDAAGVERFLRGGESEAARGLPRRDFAGASLLDRPWDLVRHLPATLSADAVEARAPRLAPSARIHPTAVLVEDDGPILVGEGAVIEPLAVIVGPAVIGPEAVVKAHAHIRGSVIGRGSRVGGEISASIFLPYSNKQHDGFLGHSVVGSWVNIGAGATGSNLKNTYGEIQVDGEKTGLNYLGQIIGDHTKIGIQAVMNTGSIYGVGSCIVAGAGPLPRRIADFDFVGRPTAIESFLATARTVMGRRGRTLEATEEALLRALHAEAGAESGARRS